MIEHTELGTITAYYLYLSNLTLHLSDCEQTYTHTKYNCTGKEKSKRNEKCTYRRVYTNIILLYSLLFVFNHFLSVLYTYCIVLLTTKIKNQTHTNPSLVFSTK